MDKLQAFLLELDKGFAFVARQQRISTESKDFFIDLVFYNYLLTRRTPRSCIGFMQLPCHGEAQTCFGQLPTIDCH